MAARINYVAVLVAAVAYFVWGGIWYTALGGIWDTLVGAHSMSATPYVISFVLGFPLAFVIAYLLANMPEATGPSAGALIGGVVGLGVWATNLLGVDMFEAKPIALWLIDAGYAVIGMAIVGAIIGGWRRRA